MQYDYATTVIGYHCLGFELKCTETERPVQSAVTGMMMSDNPYYSVPVPLPSPSPLLKRLVAYRRTETENDHAGRIALKGGTFWWMNRLRVGRRQLEESKLEKL